MKHHPLETFTQDEVYTAIANMLRCFEDAEPVQDNKWVRMDLRAAADRLSRGPWRHLGGSTESSGLPFEIQIIVLGSLVERLRSVCTDPTALTALDGVRYHLAYWPIWTRTATFPPP